MSMRSTRMSKSRLIRAVAAGCCAVSAGTVLSATASPAPARPGSAAGDMAQAAARARLTGRPVEITSVTTPTQRTLANADGTLTMELNPQPVRVKRDGAWVPLDATLRRNADGTFSPAA